ncbi:hypothetical protein N407_06330 [Helicobacter pylori FD662]|nr:hypothetical protein N407_06330 [Helicobacter pylori FD662]
MKNSSLLNAFYIKTQRQHRLMDFFVKYKKILGGLWC